jgi:hypothetical protein
MRRLLQVAAACAMGIGLSGCVSAPEGTGMQEFRSGRWSDESGKYWIEFSQSDQQFSGELPVEVTRRGTPCVNGVSAGPVHVEGSWTLWPTFQSIDLEFEGSEDYLFGFGPYYESDWSVLDISPCGIDYWPPIWLKYEGANALSSS